MRPRSAAIAAAGLATAAVAAVVVALSVGASPARLRSVVGGDDVKLTDPAKAAPAPELAGITRWHNTPPLTIRGLRGRVVLVDFWTYSCINCRRTLPFLRALHETYADRGLTVLGVHTPEFDFEKSSRNVTKAVGDLRVTWPVAEDPAQGTWDAFGNQYWPADYLIDREGRLRLFHPGEGEERFLEDAVRTLLNEGGAAGDARTGDRASSERPPPSNADITPETYLGESRGEQYLADGIVPSAATVERHDGTATDRDVVTLDGRFTGGTESLTFEPAARLRQRFRARDVYAVLAPVTVADTAVLEVLLDGHPVPPDRRGRDLEQLPDGATVVRVRGDDLRHLLSGPAVSDGELTLVARDRVRIFTFTYGA
jgi:thiol-disulfide isomerase/thioredoxin